MGGYVDALAGQSNLGKNIPQAYSANASIPLPSGLILMQGAAAITITIPAPVAAQDGQECIFYTDTAHAHIVSFTGATLLSVGVAKTTSTSGGLVGEFLKVFARNGFWNVESSAGQTFA